MLRRSDKPMTLDINVQPFQDNKKIDDEFDLHLRKNQALPATKSEPQGPELIYTHYCSFKFVTRKEVLNKVRSQKKK